MKKSSAILLVSIFILVKGCKVNTQVQSENPDLKEPESPDPKEPESPDPKVPSVMIILLARNKAHVLPHVLALLEKLDYPQNRIDLYIRSDHNEDDTGVMLEKWIKKLRESDAYDYNAINEVISHEDEIADEEYSPFQITDERYSHIMDLKEDALNFARKEAKTDFVWFLDSDVFITNDQVLKIFTKMEHTISAPLIRTSGYYSNFWAGMTEDYYYSRTEDYIPILERKKLGCFEVKNVHTSYFVNLRNEASKLLTFLPSKINGYDGPYDDLISFPLSAQFNNVPLMICNQNKYGFVMQPVSDEYDLDFDRTTNLLHLKLEILAEYGPLPYLEEFKDYLQEIPPKDKLGVDKIYLINLERRSDRREKMDKSFELLGIDYELVNAVDGRKIDEKYIERNGIEIMEEFVEPYQKRTSMTYGEIGCFMSHYHIWQDVVKNSYKEVIIFEDDIRFETYFRDKYFVLRDEIKKLDLKWDLLYLGRKILYDSQEDFVKNSKYLVHVDYTYWTLSYMLTYHGAKKLLDEKPLSKMVPVDEYLPIMFNRHWNTTWMVHYEKRDLMAFSAEPRLVHPTHYTGEEGYISDTEVVGVKDEL